MAEGSANKFHLSRDGNPRPCGAQPGNCPLGPGEPHYSSREEARSAYEEKMQKVSRKTFTNPKLPRNAIATKNLKPGMKFRRPHSADETVYTLKEPVTSNGFLKTDQGTLQFGRHWDAGTVRLVDPPEGYDYHSKN